MTKTDLLVGLSEIRVTPTARTPPRPALRRRPTSSQTF